MKRFMPMMLLLAGGLGCAPLPPVPVGETTQAVAGALTQVTSFGSNPAGLRMWKYVPDMMPPNAPLVLALHACTQQAADFTKTGWNTVADQYKFYVVYPEQTSQNNGLECFNWAGVYGNPANLTRGQGENLSIKQMVDQMKKDHSIDPRRVFITGLSGGAAETSLMLATWPDVFAGGATFAGIPYHCTTDFTQVTTCLKPGISMTPKQWGDYVRNAYPGYAGPWPSIAVWQGSNDSVVSTNNQTELVKQWTDVHGISQTPSGSDLVAGVPHDVYKDASGKVVVETYKVQGMDHGMPIDPKHMCGTPASYILDVGVCAAYWVAVSWGIASATSSSGGDGGTSAGDADGGSVAGDGGSGSSEDGGNGTGNGSGNGNGNGGGGGNGGGKKTGTCAPAGCAVAEGAQTGDALFILLALCGLLVPLRRRA